jgi:hypothetical protein
MKSAAGEGGVRAPEPRRRERHERRCRALGMLAQREVCRRGACRHEEASACGVGGPAAEGDPAAAGGGAHHRERADASTHGHLRRAEQRPHRERQADRAGGVQPPRQDLPRHHEHAGAATLALVPPAKHARHRRCAVRRGRTADLALPGAVPVNHEIAARRSGRSSTSKAPRWPGQRHRRHRGKPGLDAQRTSANLVMAPHLQCSELDAEGVRQDQPSASPFLWAGTTPSSASEGFLRHHRRARNSAASVISIAATRDRNHQPACAGAALDLAARGLVNTRKRRKAPTTKRARRRFIDSLRLGRSASIRSKKM